MFVYAFKILNIGSTQIDIVNSELSIDTGSTIPHNVSSCTIEIRPLQEWIDSEYAELKIENDLLITTYTQYTISHSHNNDEYNSILSERDHWISEYNSLNATHSQYVETYSHSDFEYTNLLSEFNYLNQSLGTSQVLNYVLIIVSIS